MIKILTKKRLAKHHAKWCKNVEETGPAMARMYLEIDLSKTWWSFIDHILPIFDYSCNHITFHTVFATVKFTKTDIIIEYH